MTSLTDFVVNVCTPFYTFDYERNVYVTILLRDGRQYLGFSEKQFFLCEIRSCHWEIWFLFFSKLNLGV